MKKPDFLKKPQKSEQNERDNEKPRDHSLQAQAKKRAQNPENMHAGTAFDWEDLDAYQQELERLDKEGPGKPKASD